MTEIAADTATPTPVVKLELTIEALHRFSGKVDQKGPDECWPWKAHRDKDGYGKFSLNGRNIGAHRVSFEISHRLLEPGELVCHTCDFPPCSNPAHLFAGTHLDNHRDRDAKGRKACTKGGKNGQSRFTDEDVIEIRRRFAAGENKPALARAYGCHYTAIRFIVDRKRWTHI